MPTPIDTLRNLADNIQHNRPLVEAHEGEKMTFGEWRKIDPDPVAMKKREVRHKAISSEHEVKGNGMLSTARKASEAGDLAKRDKWLPRAHKQFALSHAHADVSDAIRAARHGHGPIEDIVLPASDDDAAKTYHNRALRRMKQSHHPPVLWDAIKAIPENERSGPKTNRAMREKDSAARKAMVKQAGLKQLDDLAKHGLVKTIGGVKLHISVNHGKPKSKSGVSVSFPAPKSPAT